MTWRARLCFCLCFARAFGCAVLALACDVLALALACCRTRALRTCAYVSFFIARRPCLRFVLVVSVCFSCACFFFSRLPCALFLGALFALCFFCVLLALALACQRLPCACLRLLALGASACACRPSHVLVVLALSRHKKSHAKTSMRRHEQRAPMNANRGKLSKASANKRMQSSIHSQASKHAQASTSKHKQSAQASTNSQRKQGDER